MTDEKPSLRAEREDMGRAYNLVRDRVKRLQERAETAERELEAQKAWRRGLTHVDPDGCASHGLGYRYHRSDQCPTGECDWLAANPPEVTP